MKVKFLGITQERYRSTSKEKPVRILEVSRGAIVDLPDERVAKLQKDYPQDWQIISRPAESLPLPEPVAGPSGESNDHKGEPSVWTRQKAAKK